MGEGGEKKIQMSNRHDKNCFTNNKNANTTMIRN